jgi:replicative DNA helicase
LSEAAGKVAGYPMLIDDNSEHSSDTVWATARRVNLTYPLGLIVIDYLQLLTDRGEDDDNSRLTRITRRLKAMARDLNVPVLCLSQLSRANEKGFGKPRPPRLSDLRGSGSIEQDADVVIFLHCEEEDKSLPVRPTQLIVAKQRNGPVGDHPVMFDRPKQRFGETDPVHEAPPVQPPRQNRLGEYDNDNNEEEDHG